MSIAAGGDGRMQFHFVTHPDKGRPPSGSEVLDYLGHSLRLNERVATLYSLGFTPFDKSTNDFLSWPARVFLLMPDCLIVCPIAANLATAFRTHVELRSS